MIYILLIQGALDYADERSSSSSNNNANTSSSSSSTTTTANNTESSNNSQGALIFLHAGTYRGEFLVIDSDIVLIGKIAGFA